MTSTTRSLPFLPGFVVQTDFRTSFAKRSVFKSQNGVVLCNEPGQKQASANKPGNTNILGVCSTPAPASRSQSDLRRRLPNTATTMNTLPAWIAFDGKVLRFQAYFRQEVHESPVENNRVRRCVIEYFLQDGTVAIRELHEDNSGLSGGKLLRRHKVKHPNSKGYFGVHHFKVGTDIELYGRVYHVYDADKRTREFYRTQYNQEQGKAEQVPEDAFHEAKRLKAERTLPDDFEPVSAHFEAVHGKLQRRQLDRLRKFLSHDGRVLRFWAVWRNPFLQGEERPLVLHYFLEDDTVEVLEIQVPNSGRYNFPSMLKRQKLRKSLARFGTDNIGDGADPDCYTDADLRCGQIVRVFGREILLLRADESTKEYYRSKYGIEQTQMVLPDPDMAEEENMSAEQNFSGGEDVPPELHKMRAIANAIDDAKSRHKSMTREQERTLKQKVLKFLARQVSTRAEDVSRQFVIQFYPVDETVSVFEKPIRNSGFIAGKFIERSILYNHNENRVFQQSDFVIGNTVQINGFVFELIDADASTKRLLEGYQPGIQKMNISSVTVGLRNLFKSKNVALRDTFRIFDTNKSGFLKIDEFSELLDIYGWELPKEQIQELFDLYDTNRDGRISFQEFADQVELCEV